MTGANQRAEIGEIAALGRIIQWPDGYAMTLALRRGGNRIVRCCPGHETPEAAKDHGLVRLVEVSSGIADGDIALWAAEDAP